MDRLEGSGLHNGAVTKSPDERERSAGDFSKHVDQQSSGSSGTAGVGDRVRSLPPSTRPHPTLLLFPVICRAQKTLLIKYAN